MGKAPHRRRRILAPWSRRRCPLSPFNFNVGLAYNYFPASQQPGEEDEGRINPLAGMGLTDEQYNRRISLVEMGSLTGWTISCRRRRHPPPQSLRVRA